MRCPNCGTANQTKDRNRAIYECGYWAGYDQIGNFEQGICRRTKPMKTPSDYRPKVKVYFHDDGSPKELHVITNTSKRYETFDEFDGMVKVQANKESKKISKIILDCDKLGGRAYETNLLALLATMQKSKYHPRFGPLNREIERCIEIVGQDRIDARIALVAAKKKEKWGELHPLIQNVIEGNIDAPTKLSDMLKKITYRQHRFATLDEAICTALDYRNGDSLNGRISMTMGALLRDLEEVEKGLLCQYFDTRLMQGMPCYLEWYFFINAFDHQSLSEKIDFIQTGLEYMTQFPPTDDNSQVLYRIKQYLLDNYDMAVGGLGGKEDLIAAVKFLTKIVEKDPQDSIKNVVQNTINMYDGADGPSDSDGKEWNDSLDDPFENDMWDPSQIPQTEAAAPLYTPETDPPTPVDAPMMMLPSIPWPTQPSPPADSM